MDFGRKDYDLETLNSKIGKQEPVFLLRAQDINAPGAVRDWVVQAVRSGVEKEVIFSALQQAEKMEQWQRENKTGVADFPPIV